MPDDQPLTVRELACLELERKWWRYAGAKDSHIRETFGLSPTRYYQVLNSLIDRPAALAYDAQTVERLRRLREHRAAARPGFR